jgi:hypothetical protein
MSAHEGPHGIVHTHDRRICWDCGGIGIVAQSISLKITDRTLALLGWRYLEPGGRMICSECRRNRHRGQSKLL